MKRREACNTCRYWQPDQEGGEYFGSCHRYAPRPAPETDAPYDWISTQGEDWCGEWEESAEARAERRRKGTEAAIRAGGTYHEFPSR